MDSHCRVRAPGAAQPADCPPPTTQHAALAARLGHARLHTLYDQATWSEGPAWWEAQRTLVWSDVVGRRVLGWREDGAVDVLLDATAFTNGNAVDTQQRLVHCEHGRRAITRSEVDGRAHLLVGRFEGKRLNSPNDLIVARDGAIWFTDPPFGLRKPSQGCPGPQELDHHGVYRLPPDGGALQCMVNLDHPNGWRSRPTNACCTCRRRPKAAQAHRRSPPWIGTMAHCTTVAASQWCRKACRTASAWTARAGCGAAPARACASSIAAATYLAWCRRRTRPPIAPSIWCNAAYSSPAAARCGCWTCSDKSGYQHDSAAVRRTCPRLARRRISA